MLKRSHDAFELVLQENVPQLLLTCTSLSARNAPDQSLTPTTVLTLTKLQAPKRCVELDLLAVSCSFLLGGTPFWSRIACS
jgi:hypothetical protein